MASLQVLVAEDEPLNALALESQITALGHRVLGPATTGEESVRLASEHAIDLAVLDLRMPGGTGLDAAKRIFEIRPTPIVVLTDYGDEEAAEQAARAPVFHYLIKPVSTEDLLPAIHVARRRFQEWRALRAEIAGLERRLGEHKLIERAKGVIMDRRGVAPEEAARILDAESRRADQSTVEVARSILTAEALLRGTVAT